MFGSIVTSINVTFVSEPVDWFGWAPIVATFIVPADWKNVLTGTPFASTSE